MFSNVFILFWKGLDTHTYQSELDIYPAILHRELSCLWARSLCEIHFNLFCQTDHANLRKLQEGEKHI